MHLQDFSNISDVKNVRCGKSSDEIYLYTMSLNSSRHDILNLVTYLTSQEKDHANSYYTKELSENYIIAHSTLRKVLSYHTKTYLHDVEFFIGKYGKPYLKNNQQNIGFNMSHSKDMLCIVVTKDAEVGVDVEFKDSSINVEELQNLVFSKQETEYINLLESHAQKREFFYNLWTLKEAMVKSIGLGLSYPINQINLIDEALNVKNSGIIKTTEPIQEHKLSLISCMTPSTSLNIDKDYSYAIARRSNHKKVVQLELDATMTHNNKPKFFLGTQKTRENSLCI